MKNLLFLLFLSLMINVYGQVAINTDSSLPDNSAMLDVKSSTRGVLIPRTSSSSRLAIVNPAKGLMLYDTTTSSFWFYNASIWKEITTGSNGWNLTGNGAIDISVHFIGTTDEQPLRFKVNNAWAGEIHPTSGNLFFGLGTGQANTIGEANTAIGENSLFSNTEGALNTAFGNQALYSNTTGSYNAANGASTLYSNTTGDNNTANGYQSLNSNTNGFNNTANGCRALFSNTNGIYNTANGFQALYSNTIGNYNTANGIESLYYNSDGNSNTATGSYALYYNTTGFENTANGVEALFSNATGSENSADGYHALYSNTTGWSNTANGFRTLYFNTLGNENTASGYDALFSNTTASNNTAFGTEALYSNTTGQANTAIGSSLYYNTTGNQNTAIGHTALYNNITGFHNIAIGSASGPAPGFTNLSNTIGIGNDGSYQHGASNQVVIGNASMLVIAGKVGWSILSDARIKNTINEDVKGLDFILKLRPVTYHISNAAITAVTGSKETPDFPGKYDGEKVKYSGFIAQEVEQAAKAANYEFSGYDTPKNEWGLYTIKYAEFVVPLVKAVQELNAVNEAQKVTNEDLKQTIEAQKLINAELKAQNEILMQRLEKLENK